MKWLLGIHSPVDGSVQNVAPQAKYPILLYFAQYSTITGDLEKCRMYDTLRPEYYWPNKLTDVFGTVGRYQYWPWLGTKSKAQRQLQLLPPSGPFELLVIDIVDALLRIMLFISDRYS